MAQAAPTDQRSFWHRNRIAITPWLFLAPGLIMFMIYVILPIFQSMWISLHQWDGLSPKIFIGLDNYRELMTDDTFFVAIKNNIIWLVLYMLAVPIGLFISLLLNQTVMGIRIYKSLFFFPFVISQIVVGLVFTWVYDPSNGIFSIIFGWFGATCPAILGDERYVTYGIIAAGLWPQIAYCMILFLTGLNNVSPDQIEAGRLDNAKGWKMLWYVVLPQLRPATFIAIVVTVIGALRSFDLISIMTSGGPYGSSQVLAYYMYETALSEYGYRMGYGATIATVLFFIMMVYIAYFLRRMYVQEKEG
ncbi:MAG: sugar ABC transporter permease [Spartobacteria bacterium]|nr:sugar ABC transporter permease [Spartobacteria bacterium]